MGCRSVRIVSYQHYWKGKQEKRNQEITVQTITSTVLPGTKGEKAKNTDNIIKIGIIERKNLYCIFM